MSVLPVNLPTNSGAVWYVFFKLYQRSCTFAYDPRLNITCGIIDNYYKLILFYGFIGLMKQRAVAAHTAKTKTCLLDLHWKVNANVIHHVRSSDVRIDFTDVVEKELFLILNVCLRTLFTDLQISSLIFAMNVIFFLYKPYLLLGWFSSSG